MVFWVFFIKIIWIEVFFLVVRYLEILFYNKDFWYKMCNVNDIDCIG